MNYHTFNSLRRNISKCTTCGQGVDAPEHGIKVLQDLDPMPFGKHKGMPMQDVPAGYLHWFWSTVDRPQNIDTDPSESGQVARYVKSHLEHLKKEHPDGIWK